MSTLLDQITADAGSVFLDADGGFATEIAHWPAGVEANAETVTAIVFFDDESRTHPTYPGGGDSISTEDGRRIRQTVLLELSSTVTVTIGASPSCGTSKFIVEGNTFTALRVSEHDDGGLQTVRAARTVELEVKRTVTRP